MTVETCLLILILGIATWRISHLLMEEEGPFDLVLRFRLLIGMQYAGEVFDREAETLIQAPLTRREVMQSARDGTLVNCFVSGRNMIARMLVCMYCTSIWVSFGLVALALLTGMTMTVFEGIVVGFSGSALAVWINEKM